MIFAWDHVVQDVSQPNLQFMLILGLKTEPSLKIDNFFPKQG